MYFYMLTGFTPMTPRSTLELKIKIIACTRPRINPKIMAVDAVRIVLFPFLFVLFPLFDFVSETSFTTKKTTKVMSYFGYTCFKTESLCLLFLHVLNVRYI